MPVFPNVFPLAAAGVAFSPRMLRRVLLIGALALLVPLLGLFVVGMHVPQAERESYEEMEAVAALKAEQIENWLSERRADGETLKSRGFVQRVAEWRRAGQASERAAIYDLSLIHI